jgi:transcriptional regulator GlxA family with amidase domain
MGRMIPKRIGFFVFDDVVALDFVGPIEAFSTAAIIDDDGNGRRGYEVITIGVTGKTVVSGSGLRFQPDKSISNAPILDTLVVPGGAGLRRSDVQRAFVPWLKGRLNNTRRIASVCTGIYGLASAGLLDGRQATTHWHFAKDLVRRFPKIRLNDNAIFIKDGRFYTSAGVTAGIDLSLALIEEDFGPKIALAVARELVVYLKRAGGQEQYSEPLRFQIQSTDRFSEMAAWVAGHLDEDLSVDALAERASCSRRHFSRRFKEVFGSTPAHFIEELRLTEARHHLSLPRNSLKTVAALVGFKSVDSFSRAFERRFGVRPNNYRRRFHPSARQNRKRIARLPAAA